VVVRLCASEDQRQARADSGGEEACGVVFEKPAMEWLNEHDNLLLRIDNAACPTATVVQVRDSHGFRPACFCHSWFDGRCAHLSAAGS
jgi:hypothetical protein